MSFSFSAPSISEEEYREEYESFTDEECKAIEDDLYGKEGSFLPELENDDKTIQQSLEMFQIALDDIPAAEKEHYLKALHVAPKVVEQECNPLSFLRIENFDPWAAAQRMTAYWRLRRSTFGDDRAFLPMTLKGALQKDANTLARGHIALLPPDRQGRPVCLVDRVKFASKGAERDAYVRVFFYIMHTISQTKVGAMKGCVLTYDFRSYDLFKHYDRYLARTFFDILHTIPVVAKSAHFVAGNSMVLRSIVLPVLRHISGKRGRHRVVLHAGSECEISQQLSAYGFSSEQTRPLFQNKHKTDGFREWWTRQKEFEREA